MTFSKIEKCFLPPPEIVRWDQGKIQIETYSPIQKIVYCAQNAITLLSLIALLPFSLAAEYFSSKESQPVEILEGNSPVWPPSQRGFAMSFFQSSGLGTKWSATPLIGKCDWDKWMDDPKHILHKPGFDYRNFFTDILSDPTSYIEMLKSQNVTAHRFSLEWSVLEPKPGHLDDKALQLYRNFIDKLLDAGITPSVTLSHFVLPEWFYESGGFQNPENIDAYVDFASCMMELFPKVQDWWSFNELGIKGFQQIREVYPTDIPEGSFLPNRVHKAGVATRNMLIAHCKLHQKVATQHPDKKLGITHQWLKFDTASGNLLERAVAHLFTNLAFTPVYDFFKTGTFAFQVPFCANIQFEIPKKEFEKNQHFLMRLGVQTYPKPMVKMGLNHGKNYPGLSSAIKNLPLFSFGASCEEGGTVMRFGPRWRASAIEETLDEAFALTPNVFITEIGSDSVVQKWEDPAFNRNDQAQKEYLQALLSEVHKYTQKKFRQIEGIFCWSDLRTQLEWNEGDECCLGSIDQKLDENRRIIGWEQTPTALYLQKEYA